MANAPAFKNLVAKLRHYPIAIAAFGICIIAVVVILVRASALSNLNDMLAAKEEQWVRITNNLRNANNLEDDVARILAANETIQDRLMIPAERALNDQYFYDLRNLTNVRISSLDEQGLVETKSSKIAGIAEFKEYSLIDYRVTVEGNFEQILAFSTRLSTGRHFARVSAFSLARVADGGAGQLSLSLQLQMLGVKQ